MMGGKKKRERELRCWLPQAKRERDEVCFAGLARKGSKSGGSGSSVVKSAAPVRTRSGADRLQRRRGLSNCLHNV